MPESPAVSLEVAALEGDLLAVQARHYSRAFERIHGNQRPLDLSVLGPLVRQLNDGQLDEDALRSSLDRAIRNLGDVTLPYCRVTPEALASAVFLTDIEALKAVDVPGDPRPKLISRLMALLAPMLTYKATTDNRKKLLGELRRALAHSLVDLTEQRPAADDHAVTEDGMVARTDLIDAVNAALQAGQGPVVLWGESGNGRARWQRS